MKSIVQFLVLLFIASSALAQTDEQAITETCNNYLEGFYEGNTEKLKLALKPRLYKFGYWKNKDSKEYEYSSQMTYDKAIAFAKNVLEKKKFPAADAPKEVKVLDIGNHIAAAKVTAWWGIDYMLLSKEDGKWMIEQVIWEGPLEKSHRKAH